MVKIDNLDLKELKDFNKEEFTASTIPSKPLRCGYQAGDSTIYRKAFDCDKCHNGHESVIITAQGYAVDLRGVCSNCRNIASRNFDSAQIKPAKRISKVGGVPPAMQGKLMKDLDILFSKTTAFSYVNNYERFKKEGVNLFIYEKNPLFLTNILAAICNEMAEKHSNLNVVFVNTRELADSLIRSDGEQTAFHKCDVLGIDDLAGVPLSQRQNQVLYDLAVYRLQNLKTNFLASRYDASELQNLIPTFGHHLAGSKPLTI